MKVEKVDHIHIYTRDFDKAKRFFSELLGTKFTEADEPQDSKERGFRAAIDPLGLELLASTSPDGEVGGAIERWIERRGEGLAGLSLKVPNIEEATAEMQSRGIRVIGRNRGEGLEEVRFHPKDCHGIIIELCEYAEQHAILRGR